MPIVKAIPAIPGNVNVACKSDKPAKRKMMLKTRAIFAKIPKNDLYVVKFSIYSVDYFTHLQDHSIFDFGMGFSSVIA